MTVTPLERQTMDAYTAFVGRPIYTEDRFPVFLTPHRELLKAGAKVANCWSPNLAQMRNSYIQELNQLTGQNFPLDSFSTTHPYVRFFAALTAGLPATAAPTTGTQPPVTGLPEAHRTQLRDTAAALRDQADKLDRIAGA